MHVVWPQFDQVSCAASATLLNMMLDKEHCILEPSHAKHKHGNTRLMMAES